MLNTLHVLYISHASNSTSLTTAIKDETIFTSLKVMTIVIKDMYLLKSYSSTHVLYNCMKYKRVKKITININKHSIRQLTLRIKTMLFLVCSLFSTKPTTTKSREDNKVEHSTTGREKRRGSN